MLSILLEKPGLFFRRQPFERQGRVHFLVSYPHCHISIHGLSVDTVGWTGLILSLLLFRPDTAVKDSPRAAAYAHSRFDSPLHTQQ